MGQDRSILVTDRDESLRSGREKMNSIVRQDNYLIKSWRFRGEGGGGGGVGIRLNDAELLFETNYSDSFNGSTPRRARLIAPAVSDVGH